MDYITPDPEFWHREVTIKLDVLTLMAVHGNLLLALRHPQNIGESRHLVVEFVKQAGKQLVIIGAISIEQLIEAYLEEAKHGNEEFIKELDKPPDAGHRTSKD